MDIMAITIDRGYRDNGPAPLSHQYDGQHEPQPAYISLDEDGEVRVDYSGELGNARPMSVHLGRTIRWRVPSNLSVDGIDWLLERLMPLLERVHTGHTVAWDGSNNSGTLSEDGREASEDIEQTIDGIVDNDSYMTPLCDACEWVSAQWEVVVDGYRKATDKSAYLDLLVSIARDDGITLVNVDKLTRELNEAVVVEFTS